MKNIRPQTGQEAAAWIQSNLAAYFTRPTKAAYRSSAAWALRQMDDRFSILRPDTVVLDLGCFPGGWSEVAVERAQASCSSSKVIGVDSTYMDPLEYHTFIQGDVAKQGTVQSIIDALGGTKADVVLSDLAPRVTGLKQEDHVNSMQCSLYAAKIMDKTLRLGGSFVVRSMFGAEQGHWRTYLNSRFDTVRTIRPAASRSQFGEMFHICSGFIGRQSIASEVQVEGNDLSRYEGVEEWQGELQWLRGQGLLDETDYIPPKEVPPQDPTT